jgi:hypothetical protein
MPCDKQVLSCAGVPKNAQTIGDKTIEITTVTGIDGKTTTISKTISKIHTTWKNLSKTTKYMICGYLTVGAINICYETYNVGKSELLEYRTIQDRNKSEVPSNRTREKHKSDFDAVKYGCSYNSGERVWNGLLWPIEIYSNTIPHVVLALNPKDNSNTK